MVHRLHPLRRRPFGVLPCHHQERRRCVRPKEVLQVVVHGHRPGERVGKERERREQHSAAVEEEDAGQVRHEMCVRSVRPMRVESKQVVGAARTNRRSSEVSGLVSRPLDP